MRSIIFLGRMGCLLPFLIIINLFFGWIFFSFLFWVFIEVILILLFVLVSLFTAKKIFRQTQQKDNIIDIEAEVLDDKPKIGDKIGDGSIFSEK